MKTGILTLHEADSYGAVLQAYALQRTLERLSTESEFLSFARVGAEPPRTADRYPPALIGRIRREGERRAAVFAGFRSERLRCAAPVPWREAAEAAAGYERIIVGSDQVWNPRIPGVDERYFLPFAPPEKRFSYAASFGAEDLPAGVRDWCAGQLRDFAGLSVREESGRRLIQELTGRDAAVCLDPTLLLARGEWEALAAPPECEGYVLAFLLKFDGPLLAAAKEEATRRGVEIKTAAGAFMPQLGFDAWSGVGVERWLGLIRNAGCVFTNSFHGAVFSLLFGRPLRTAGLEGALAGRSGRIEELLRRAGMEESFKRVCPAPSGSGWLDPGRKASMNYLREIVSGGTL